MSDNYLRIILALLVMAQFVVVLDFSIVQIALPTIRNELNFPLANLQWVISAYGITYAGFLMLSGRASDIYGRKRLFIVGLIIFALASLACGLSPSALMLIIFRAIQGIGAALASATGLALIIATFAPIGKLNWALSIFTAVSSAAFTAGVVLGGALTEIFGWRAIFFVTVPIGLAAAAVSPHFLHESFPRNRALHLDLPGAVLVTSGLLLLIYALTNVANSGLTSGTFEALTFAAIILAVFLLVEHRSREPLIPLSFLRRGIIFTANAIGLLLSAAVYGLIFMLSLYWQQIKMYPSLIAGLAFVPASIIFFFVGGFIAARLINRFGMKIVLASSLAIITVGFLLFSGITVNESYLSLLPALILFALGGAIGFTSFNIAAVDSAQPGEEGLASGLANTAGEIGGPIGIAIVVTVIGIVTQGFANLGSSDALVNGFHYGFIGAAILTAIALMMSFLIKRPNPKNA